MRPEPAYERAVDAFARRLLTDRAASTFRRSVGDFVRLIRAASRSHSISQLILEVMMPGVADVYQVARTGR
jgi:maltooligosyltrehalose synthase